MLTHEREARGLARRFSRTIRAFPEDVRQVAGFQLWRVQRGLEPNDSKPMPGVGIGVHEIRIHTDVEHRARQRFHALINQRAGAKGWVTMKRVQPKRSSGDVFRDLGFSADEADHLRVRSELMTKVQKVITARGLKQAAAAQLLGVTQPRVSDLMRSRIDLFNVETLIEMLAKLGVRTKVVLEPRRRRAGVA